MTIPEDGLPVREFATDADFHAWLDAHGSSAPGVWIRMAKKASGIESVDWDGAVDVALCHGWIDGQRRAVDADWFAQRFTPRRARSVWSKINRGRVERLEAEGRMLPGGRAEVDRAKADGRWDAAYDPVSSAEVPAELQAALDASPAAAAAFAALSSQNRFACIYRIQTAKRAETRERNAAKFVAMLERGEVLHPDR